MSGRPATFLGLGAIGAPMAARLAGSGGLTVWNRTRARAEHFAKAHGARLALLDKDVGIARDLLRQVGVDGPLLDRSGELLREARAALGESADYLEAIRLIESRAGVEIRG